MIARNFAICWIAAVVAGAALAPADVVKLMGKPPFRNVRVTDFRNGRLAFRGVSGETIRKALAEIEWLEIDAAPELTAAEAAARSGEWSKAAAEYARVADAPERPWLGELARMRRLPALDEAGEFADAVGLYLELVDAKGSTVRALAPRRAGPPGSRANAAARRLVEQRLAEPRRGAGTDEARAILLQLYILDNVAPFPPKLVAERPAWSVRPAPAKLDGTAANDDDAPVVTLPGDAFLLDGAAAAFREKRSAESAGLLDRAIPYLAEADQPRWRLLLARCWLEDGRLERASNEFRELRFVEDAVIAASAVYYVGLAEERLGATETAATFYRDAASRRETPPELKQAADAALRRLAN